MEIKKCTPAVYPEFLDALNDSFGYDRGWFQREWSHCTPPPGIATTQEIERHYICEIDGKIAGGLGAYPMDWVVTTARIVGTTKVEQRTVSAYGIGQVCCLPEFRNRGVMSALMKAAEEDMRSAARPVGYLGGDRRRYGYFGYDFGGNTVKYYPDKKLLELYCKEATANTASPADLKIRQATYTDWQEINQAYETLPSYVRRSPRAWELQFARASSRWFIGEHNGHKGYMCARPEHPGSPATGEAEPKQATKICELYGEPTVLAAMLLNHANSLSEGKTLQVAHAAQNIIATPAGQMLYETAAYVESEPNGLFAIPDAPKLLQELEINPVNVLIPTKKAIARQLLNFTPLPEKQPYIQPLCAWIPSVDSI